jgi:hypothetical protein
VLDTLEKDSQEVFQKRGGDGGTGVYMREETTSKVMAADNPYGEFYDFYSVSPEYFVYYHVPLPSNGTIAAMSVSSRAVSS